MTPSPNSLLTPILLKTADTMPWPEDESVFHLVTSDGLFLCRNHPFFTSSVPVAILQVRYTAGIYASVEAKLKPPERVMYRASVDPAWVYGSELVGLIAVAAIVILLNRPSVRTSFSNQVDQSP